ncbi:MAG: LLM class F420-dependent oxidoreductase [Alphaproteobacteria bacterium]|nr:LLM class F420-dependent oxidoreductase [Alphaproteobacteria bacterium]
MKFGVAMFMTDYSMGPAELAIALEERGLESLWAPEHSHIPLPRVSPWGGGDELPKKYYDVMDPFVCLAAAAAVTKNLKVATGVALVVQRDPIQLAKEVASLDQISGGRFLFGVGGGWNAEEMADHGTAFKTRFKLMRERIEAMQQIWTQTKPEYHGELVDFGTMMTWPKPVQKPYPPIIVGGGFPHAAKRAIRYGDGWIPLGGRMNLLDILPKFWAMAEAAGRRREDLPVTNFGPPADEDLVKRNIDAGVDRIVVSVDSAKAATILPTLDKVAELNAKY